MLAARAGHEVRGPLCTAQLALDGLERSARVEAIGLELQRAALALDDLTGSPRPRRGGRASTSADCWRTPRRRGTRSPAAHGVTLAVEPRRRAACVGDRLRLAQACGNLVANAIEHGAACAAIASHGPRLFDDDEAIRDWSASARHRGRPVRIEVRDAGPGLPAPVGELVAAARGRRSARGHGLAIAAAVAESHGGRLASLPAARGAHLVLELPAAP